jgi:hypothetical protein
MAELPRQSSVRERARAGWRRDDRLVLLACVLLVGLELAVLAALRAAVLSGLAS